MPANPGANLGAQKLPTKPEAIGHVMPSFDSPKRYNTLVIRPEYRISLRLGRIEDLFLHSPGTDEGRMERLQVLGLFYFPLHHSKAASAFKICKQHIIDHIVPAGTSLDDFIQEKLRTWVVDGGELPPPAEDPAHPRPENFKRIRFPGGYSYIDESGFSPNRDKDYPMAMRRENHDAQEMCFVDNPVLGSIPLIATVERRDSETNTWKPVKDATVYFQLVKPYDLPAYDPTKSPKDQICRPPLRESDMQTGAASGVGPHKTDAEMRAVHPDPDDPQVDNCHYQYGGKRGRPVAGNIFELQADFATYKEFKQGKKKLKDRPGFHAPHSGSRKSEVPGPFYPKPEEATPSGNSHKHAVKAKTNENGEAGVIFRPSPTGGDRYRIRAYIGPPTRQSDGTDFAAVQVETGTFVVWRNVRISRVLKMPATTMAPSVYEQYKAYKDDYPFGADVSTQDKMLTWFQKTFYVMKLDGTMVGFPVPDLSDMGDPACAYDGIIKQFARAYLEVDLDRGADTPVDVDDAEWKAAIKAAIKYAKKNNSVGVDVEKLVIPLDTVTAANSCVLFPLRTPRVYNAAVGRSKRISLDADGTLKTADLQDEFDGWFDSCLLYPFMHEINKAGALPGLSMMQMCTISTWHSLDILVDYSIGVGSRGCVMRGGKDFFPYAVLQPPAKTLQRDGSNETLDDYGYSALAAHEWGHNLFREHACPDPASHTARNLNMHDPTDRGYCVMTYLPMEGHFCAKCLFGLRGWKVKT